MKLTFHQCCYAHAPRGLYHTRQGWGAVGVSDRRYFQPWHAALGELCAVPEAGELPERALLYAFLTTPDGLPVLLRLRFGGDEAGGRSRRPFAQLLLPTDAQKLFYCDLPQIFTTVTTTAGASLWLDRWVGEPAEDLPLVTVDLPEAPDADTVKAAQTLAENPMRFRQMLQAGRLALDPENKRYLIIHPRADDTAASPGENAWLAFFRVLWSWLPPAERKLAHLWIGRQISRIPGVPWIQLGVSNRQIINNMMLGQIAYGFDFQHEKYTAGELLAWALPDDKEDIAEVIMQRNAAYRRIAEETGYAGTDRQKWDQLVAIFAETPDEQSISTALALKVLGVLKAFNEQEKNPPEEYCAVYDSILRLATEAGDLAEKRGFVLEALSLPFPATFPEESAEMIFTRLIDFLRHLAETQDNPAGEQFQELLIMVIGKLEKLAVPTLHVSRQETYFWKPVFEQAGTAAGSWQLLKALLYLDFKARKYRFLQLIAHAPQPLPAGADGIIPAAERTWYQDFFRMIRENSRTTPLPMQQIHRLYAQRPATAEFEMLIGYLDSRGGIGVADWIRLYQIVNTTAHQVPVLERYFAAISSPGNLHEDPREDSLYDTFLEAKDANLLAREIAGRLASAVIKGAEANAVGIRPIPITGEDQTRIASYFKNILADPILYGNFKPQRVDRRDENVLFQAVGENVYLCKLLLGGAYNHIYEQLTAPRSTPDEREYGIADIYRVLRTVGFCAEIVPGAWFPDTFPKEPRDQFRTQVLKTILREFYQSPVNTENENWAGSIIRYLELARFLGEKPAWDMLSNWFTNHDNTDVADFAPLARVFNLFANPYRTAPPIELQANSGLQPNDLSMVLTQHDTNPAFYLLECYYAAQNERYRHSDTLLTEFLSRALCCRDVDALKQEWQTLRAAAETREYATPAFFKPLLKPLFQITHHVCRKSGRYDVLKNEYLAFAFDLIAVSMREDPVAAGNHQDGEIWIDYVKIIKNEVNLIQKESDLTRYIEQKIAALRGKSGDRDSKDVAVPPKLYQKIDEVKHGSTKESQRDYLRYILENHGAINLLEEGKNLKFYQLHEFIAQNPREVSKLLNASQRYDLTALLNLLLAGVKTRQQGEQGWGWKAPSSETQDPSITLATALMKCLKNKEAKKSFLGKSIDIRSLLPDDDGLFLLFDFSRIYFAKFHHIDTPNSFDKLLLLELIARHDDDKFQEALARVVLHLEGDDSLVQPVTLLNFYLAVHHKMASFNRFLDLVTQYYQYEIQTREDQLLPLFKRRIQRFAEALVIVLEENDTYKWDSRLKEVLPLIEEFIVVEFIHTPDSRIMKQFLRWPDMKLDKQIETNIEKKVKKDPALYHAAHKNYLTYMLNKPASRRSL